MHRAARLGQVTKHYFSYTCCGYITTHQRLYQQIIHHVSLEHNFQLLISSKVKFKTSKAKGPIRALSTSYPCANSKLYSK